MSPESLPAWLATAGGSAEVLGGGVDDWAVREVGDGNLNLVFIVEGPAGSLVVKQALPYVRLVGEGWPLPLDRAWFEWLALSTQAELVPDRLPRLHHFEAEQAAVVMERLQPHVIMRKGLVDGVVYPDFADHVATFMARTLFFTSDLAMLAGEKKRLQADFCHNTELCKITEDLVFTDPYRIAELNRWTTPQLDDVAARFREDAALKVAVQELKWAFLHQAEALIHGDLHTGSIMVTTTDTRVIDPEFAFVGPIGFDVGAVLANLFLAYFSQAGHATHGDDRVAYETWVLETAGAVWTGFEARFLELWRSQGRGDAFSADLFADPAAAAALEAFRTTTMRRLFGDSLGFAGAKMVRRILGLAHVEDLERIADPDRRALCERRALAMGRQLMLGRRGLSSMAEVLDLARMQRAETRP
ncbi:MAG: S-methyl-5-thioribose kinase [Pseudomonadota bacterium]